MSSVGPDPGDVHQPRISIHVHLPAYGTPGFDEVQESIWADYMQRCMRISAEQAIAERKQREKQVALERIEREKKRVYASLVARKRWAIAVAFSMFLTVLSLFRIISDFAERGELVTALYVSLLPIPFALIGYNLLRQGMGWFQHDA